MDNHKFAFIICNNNSIMLNECIFYIHQLIIPKNYDIEILTVKMLLPLLPRTMKLWSLAMQNIKFICIRTYLFSIAIF